MIQAVLGGALAAVAEAIKPAAPLSGEVQTHHTQRVAPVADYTERTRLAGNTPPPGVDPRVHAAQQTKASELRAEGNALLRGGDAEGAARAYSDALVVDPHDRRLFSNRAVAYMQLYRVADALRDAETCITLAPAWGKGYRRAADALVQLGRSREALACAERGLVLAPTDPSLRKVRWRARLAEHWKIEVGDDCERGAALSRGYTLYAALERLELGYGGLTLHVGGARPGVEGGTPKAVQAAFAPLQALAKARVGDHGPKGPFYLVLSGPDMRVEPPVVPSSSTRPAGVVLLRMECGCLHELRSWDAEERPDVIILYNAGLWGYPSWIPTLHAIARSGVPCIVTSYNRWEAEDDAESLAQALPTGFEWLWRPEPNPFGSPKSRTAGVEAFPERTCSDNAYWCAWKGAPKQGV